MTHKAARSHLKKQLTKCLPEEIALFARMYGGFGINDNIDTVVDAMPTTSLKWATSQVAQTLIEKDKH